MTYVPDLLRLFVEERAGGRCEYCGLLSHENTLLAYEIDHIYAEKHGGKTVKENICFSCFFCNRYKGSDLASLDPATEEPEFLFHPRRDTWDEHFRLNGAIIEPLSSRARATIRLLHLNDKARIEERILEIAAGRYP
jgi:HNH endonuclease